MEKSHYQNIESFAPLPDRALTEIVEHTTKTHDGWSGSRGRISE